jgi:hypothetical protein
MPNVEQRLLMLAVYHKILTYAIADPEDGAFQKDYILARALAVKLQRVEKVVP